MSENGILIDGRLYDVHKLAKIHPGGTLRVYLHAGSDASIAFRTYHRRAFPHEKYTAYLLPSQRHEIEETKPNFKQYDELCEIVKPHLEKTKGFAPWWYFVKCFVLFVTAVSIEAYMLLNGRTWTGSAVWGIVAAWIGLNIQHDANHGAVSASGWVNRLLGLTQDYLGGSAMGWMIEHNTVHHIHTNDSHRDFDLRIPMFRLHSDFTWSPPHRVQHYILLLGEASFGAFHVLWNFVEWLQGPRGQYKWLKPWWSTHGLLFLVTVFRVAYPLYMAPSWTTFGQIVLGYSIGGFYLAFFFIMSHNFQGVNKSVLSDQGDFASNQITTSSNVGGPVLGFFNGGLNYQIEHHLFPRVHHTNYPMLAPIVAKYCKERKIPYVHFPTILDNFVSTTAHLKELSFKPQY